MRRIISSRTLTCGVRATNYQQKRELRHLMDYMRFYKGPRPSEEQLKEQIYNRKGPLPREASDPYPIVRELDDTDQPGSLESMARAALNKNPNVYQETPDAFDTTSSLTAAPHPVTLPSTFLPKSSPDAIRQRLTLPKNISVSALDNGCTIASLTNNLPFGHLRLYVKSGTRYESYQTLGFSHIFKHLAFTRTQNRSPVRLNRELEHLTTQFSSVSTREHNILSSNLISENIQYTIPIFFDQTRPKIRQYLVREAAESILGDVAFRNSYQSVMDYVHAVAYRNRGLGRSVWGNTERVSHYHEYDLGLLESWLLDRYQPENMTLVSIGGDMNHEQLAEYVYATFESLEADQEYEPDVDYQPTPSIIDTYLKENGLDKSKYVGGEYLNMDPSLEHYSHFVLGFEGVSVLDDNYYALKVVEQIVGHKSEGAYNKSTGIGLAGGRVGLFGRDETAGVQVGSVFNASYSDSGIWGLHLQVSAEVSGQQAVEQLLSVVKQIGTAGVEQEALDAAKRRAEGALRREAETAEGLADFYGRQVAAAGEGGNGRVLGVEQAVERIRSVSAEDVRRLVNGKALAKATMVGRGNVEETISLREVESRLSEIKY
eukprot:TRINITY_DN14909_c0_g1_i1.p1 TRINITY_DN14909_c0_g1~~TRINITY_DN14909_c0_g1_i1.p1  ORF type:complete len:601 (+),score=137.72 TRINITY_DN14909_c0_g1_i1:90-1892(+)